jgi:phosphoserine aminotransferase
MKQRAYNFNAGPAALPLDVLRQARDELVDFRETGLSIMEMSHRSRVYEEVHQETQQLMRELLNIPQDYQVLFLQGGASTQFAMIPMNFLHDGQAAAYLLSGSWANKALAEAKLIGETIVAASSEADGFDRIPDWSGMRLPANAAYLHLTSNETIEGTQYAAYPETGDVPLIADMSSDIMSRPIDVSRFSLIYAGAQKNLGPSGVTVVVLRESMLERAKDGLPTMLRYKTHAKQNSLYNTPPVYSIYMVNLMLKWIKQQGGLSVIEQKNREKAALLYDAIDSSGGFYRGFAERGSRSLMNITFRLATEQLEKQFVEASEAAGFVGLKGHRSVGGLRASAYNAVPYEHCAALSEFMRDFARKFG